MIEYKRNSLRTTPKTFEPTKVNLFRVFLFLKLILFIKIYVLGCSIIYLIISAFTLIAVPSLKTAHAAEIKETITLEIQKNL